MFWTNPNSFKTSLKLFICDVEGDSGAHHHWLLHWEARAAQTWRSHPWGKRGAGQFRSASYFHLSSEKRFAFYYFNMKAIVVWAGAQSWAVAVSDWGGDRVHHPQDPAHPLPHAGPALIWFNFEYLPMHMELVQLMSSKLFWLDIWKKNPANNDF